MLCMIIVVNCIAHETTYRLHFFQLKKKLLLVLYNPRLITLMHDGN